MKHYLLIVMLLFFSCSKDSEVPNAKYHLYIGTYGETADEGIEVYLFDADDGSLNHISTTPNIRSASYLAIHPEGHLLYAVNEIDEFQGNPSGAITALKRDMETGVLEVINEQATGGAGPCYISIDQSGQFVFTANYVGGSFSMLPINQQGGLESLSYLYQNKGVSVNEKKKLVPHGHTVVVDPSNRYVLATDLGTDEVITFEINLDSGQLSKSESGAWKTLPGSGPRHLAIHPNQKFVFVGMELSSTISSCKYDAESGTILEEVASTSSLPLEYAGPKSIADIHISSDGRFLYISNRGHDSIGIFLINEETGSLTKVAHQSTHGEHPRNFMIDPTGRYLLVANKNTNNVVVFEINKELGTLRYTGIEIKVTRPVCLKMAPVVNI